MKLDPRKTYTALPVILNDAFAQVDLKKGYYDGTFAIVHNGHEISDNMDYDERLDTYFHMSDDGSQFYTVMRILGHDSPEAHVPPKALVLSHAMEAMKKVLQAVSAGSMHSDDMVFANNVLSSPTFIHAAWTETGDIPLAQAKILKDIFSI
jgi:hypothetical protein